LVVAWWVDWQWIGGGEVKGVGSGDAVVVKWGSDDWRWRSSGSQVVVAVAVRAVVRAI
jgi:hypothetical protein